MVKELARSIREYKKVSIATPILVSMEVVMECIIPFIIAELVNQIKAGCDLGVIAGYGLILVVMAGLSLMFGALAGSTPSEAFFAISSIMIPAYGDPKPLNAHLRLRHGLRDGRAHGLYLPDRSAPFGLWPLLGSPQDHALV